MVQRAFCFGQLVLPPLMCGGWCCEVCVFTLLLPSHGLYVCYGCPCVVPAVCDRELSISAWLVKQAVETISTTQFSAVVCSGRVRVVT